MRTVLKLAIYTLYVYVRTRTMYSILRITIKCYGHYILIIKKDKNIDLQTMVLFRLTRKEEKTTKRTTTFKIMDRDAFDKNV